MESKERCFDHTYQRCVKIGSCTINQWAMDFEGNKNRILNSLEMCKMQGANLRIGPELEIPGYCCEDHFLEVDTVIHSWEVLAEIISDPANYTENMLCDFGMPVIHKGIMFNCRVLVYNRDILLIRPKISMADDGLYRENRWFTPWKKGYETEEFLLPKVISKVKNQEKCKFGIGIIRARDLSYAPEICEELWIPYSPSIDFSLQGCEIIGNSSGSHFQINKQERRYELIFNASKKNGGIYIYSNMIGCDGGRIYFDGGSFITLNGKLLSEGRRFMLDEVEVVFAVADLNEVSSYRSNIKSRCTQSTSTSVKIPEIYLNEDILSQSNWKFDPFYFIEPKLYSYEEEMQYGPSCWMWDYLRRSGAAGYFLALSGGADSSCVAVMISLLTRHIYQEIVENNNLFVLDQLRKIIKDEKKEYFPKSSQEICGLIFITCYMGTNHSSSGTKKNAADVAHEIGSFHINMDIDKIITAYIETFTDIFGKEKEPKFISQGGDMTQDIALQNLQARIRMILSYLLAGLVPWTQQRKGFMLCLSSGNLDEGITGYITKYDCSSADINPIGSISKVRLKKFLMYCMKQLNYGSLSGVLSIEPTAELRPTEEGKKPQTDEEDMGLTYEELSLMGQLRKDFKCGPYSMLKKLLSIWSMRKPEAVLEKVKLFFRKYSVNRHKMTTITPALHCESYSIDDNRYDLRQFLYNTYWPFQFGQMQKLIESNPDVINLK